MRISVTSRNIFRSCKRKWYFQFIDKMQPIQESPALWFGSAIHKALEKYYLDPQRRLTTALNGWNIYLDEHPLREADWAEELKLLGPNMLENYYLYDKTTPLPPTRRVEQKYVIPILHPRSRVYTGHDLVAMIDLETANEDGTTDIVDHKTAKIIQQNGGLDVDDQMTAYAYVYWRTYNELPRQIVYNTLAKTERGDPDILKDGGLSRNKSQKTTYERYLRTVQYNKLPMSEYAEVLDALKAKPVVVRQTTTRNMNEIFTFEQNLFYEIEEMTRASRSFHAAFPSPSAFGCTWCSHLMLCKAHNDGSDVEYIKRFGYKFGELNDAANDATADNPGGSGDEP